MLFGSSNNLMAGWFTGIKANIESGQWGQNSPIFLFVWDSRQGTRIIGGLRKFKFEPPYHGGYEEARGNTALGKIKIEMPSRNIQKTHFFLQENHRTRIRVGLSCAGLIGAEWPIDITPLA